MCLIFRTLFPERGGERSKSCICHILESLRLRGKVQGCGVHSSPLQLVVSVTLLDAAYPELVKYFSSQWDDGLSDE